MEIELTHSKHKHKPSVAGFGNKNDHSPTTVSDDPTDLRTLCLVLITDYVGSDIPKLKDACSYSR